MTSWPSLSYCPALTFMLRTSPSSKGMAQVSAGGRIVLRLLALATRNDIPVFMGRPRPLSGRREFPAELRRDSAELPRYRASGDPTFRRFAQLWGLFAQAFVGCSSPRASARARPTHEPRESVFSHSACGPHRPALVTLGGASRVSGNLGDSGSFQPNNVFAEWNMFIDPAAAKIVCTSGTPIRLVSLLATQ
jgi:hypothetical protein